MEINRQYVQKYSKEIQEYNEFYTERMERLARMESPSLAYNSYHFKKCVFDLIFSLNLLPDSKIADVGCGNGGHLVILNHLTKGKYEMLGIDLSDNAIKMANNYVKKRNLHNIKYISGAFEEMKIKNEFDVIFSLEVIEHLHSLEDVNKFVRALNIALKVGGHVIISTPNKGNVYRNIVRNYIPKSLSTKLLSYLNKNTEVFTGLPTDEEYHPSVMSFKKTKEIMEKNDFEMVKYRRGTPHYGAEWIDKRDLFLLFFIILDILIPQKWASFGWNTVSLWRKRY